MGVFTAALAALTLSSPYRSAASGEPYESYNYDNWGDAIPSQAGYTADRAVSGFDLGVGAFSDPSDIFFDDEGVLYITDTGNNRIIAADSSLEKVIHIYDRFTMPDGSETTLNKPMGVFVSAENGFIYIADSDNSRVLISDKEGNVQSEITKPESEVYDQKRTFLPQRVIADKGGNVYVVLGNITTGAAMFAPNGSFSGFYGANRVEPTAQIIGNYIKSIFMSDEKKAHRTRTVPSGITSFDIDGDFIFTCTASGIQTTDTVKKLNAAGRNIFANKELIFGDITPVYDTSRNKAKTINYDDIVRATRQAKNELTDLLEAFGIFLS
jgi:DNA-binding beta-propeller fold protein YncE